MLLWVSEKRQKKTSLGPIDRTAGYVRPTLVSAVSDYDFTDIHLEGYPYTWIKNRGTPNVIEERLDRAMANSKWLMIYQSAKLLNLLASHSDHSPILLQNSPLIRNGKHTLFGLKTYGWKKMTLRRWWKKDRVGKEALALLAKQLDVQKNSEGGGEGRK
ncbi:endonuclease/exonuclease/phosphatase family protein [Trifolium medium]|uniref:Endonuclease/exonuclease/phosphatase family protein n=1 Tax=Trifolium medium TaxID=97028 RepID=A0A392N8V8_9FABA|nr:endonuclease/exonuclease/phosphatase family protein [Trifolium medium]